MPDVGKIFDQMLQLARNDLIGTKGLKLAHMMAFKPNGETGLFALDLTIFEPDGTKSAFAARLRAELIGGGYEAYGFYTEVWISRSDTAGRPRFALPELDPARDEALRVIVGTRERGFARDYRMVKRPDGTVRRLAEKPYNPDATGGRFGHLLTPAAWNGSPTIDATERAVDPGGGMRH